MKRTITVRDDTILASEIAAVGMNEDKGKPEMFIRFKGSVAHSWAYGCTSKLAARKLLATVRHQWLATLDS